MNTIMNPAHLASPFNLENPANQISQLNPMHHSSDHSADTVAREFCKLREAKNGDVQEDRD